MTTPKKRKDAPNTPLSGRPAKRNKLLNARTLSSQPADAALKDGQLDVDAFVRARAFEITALERGMQGAKKALTTRAHQSVPRDLRRRTASHNVKRVPKRLRERAKREMKEDGAGTVEARRRKPRDSKGWVRADTAKRLKHLALLSRKKRGEHKGPNITTEAPKIKNGVLSEGIRPESKFRKRQRSKTWLPTHIWHSKRAHMTTPVKPLWRFSLALTPTEKSYRPTHRASLERGAVAWDMSYMSTIGLAGKLESVLSILKMLGVDGEDAWGKKGVKWRNGTRFWQGWVHGSQTKRAIAPVTIIWCSEDSEDPDMAMSNVKDEDPRQMEINSKRRLLIRIHPSAFLQLWNHLARASTTPKSPIIVEDLRYEIGSIDITGPGSTEALTGTLWPTKADSNPTNFKSPAETWKALRASTNPATLPVGALLPFEVTDPRLHHPPRSIPTPPQDTSEQLIEILSEWPPDRHPQPAHLFSADLRFAASRLPSQKSINRRKGDADPGKYPDARPTDPKIPIMLLASRSGRPSQGGQGTWTILLPWKCVQPVWYMLLHYPLSTGGVVRFGGVRENRQVTFEAGQPWFPGDFPGTAAGQAWETREREARRLEWERKPKGRRVEYDGVDLKNGEKGEIGIGWGCDWNTLVGHCGTPSAKEEMQQKHPDLFQLPSSSFRQFLNQPSTIPSSLEGALAAIKITLLSRGTAPPCSRIYRLPTSNNSLRSAWLSVLQHPKPISKRRSTQLALFESTRSDQNRVKSYLPESDAVTLREGPPTPGDEDYPAVPASGDLIGFVTEGGFCLSEGGGLGIGSILIERVLGGESTKKDRFLCIIREAGFSVGRLARWQPI
jgi:ribonuclease P/MRP protein subunit POP1